MNHHMKMFEPFFERMKNGTKTIECRCNDEKRQKIAVGDLITFTKLPDSKESLTVIVRDLYPYNNFKELFQDYKKEELGFTMEKMQDALDYMREIYPAEQECANGVLGIRVQVVE